MCVLEIKGIVGAYHMVQKYGCLTLSTVLLRFKEICMPLNRIKILHISHKACDFI